jgi:4-oxalocrotonate tautomerase
VHPRFILAQASRWAWIAFHLELQFSRAHFLAKLIVRDSQEDTEMPDVHITWLEGRTVDQKRKVAQRITQVLMEEAGAKSESTHIVFVDVPTTNFASGGVTVADRRQNP